MSKREVKLYLTDIDDAISTIQSYTKELTYEQLLGDRKTREAIILNFVVIGEAIKKIPNIQVIDYRSSATRMIPLTETLLPCWLKRTTSYALERGADPHLLRQSCPGDAREIFTGRFRAAVRGRQALS